MATMTITNPVSPINRPFIYTTAQPSRPRRIRKSQRIAPVVQEIVIVPSGGSGDLDRVQVSVTSPTLTAGQSDDFTIQAGEVFKILAFTASTPAWVRVYGTSAARAADTRTEPGGTVPLAGTGFYAELVTVASPETITTSPVPTVQAASGLTYVRLVNEDTVSRAISVTFDALVLEATP